MSSRGIVLLGLSTLLLVLVGTMTVGATVGYYVAMSALVAIVVAVLAAFTRHRGGGGQHEA